MSKSADLRKEADRFMSMSDQALENEMPDLARLMSSNAETLYREADDAERQGE